MRGRLEQEVEMKRKPAERIITLRKNLFFRVINAPCFLPVSFLPWKGTGEELKLSVILQILTGMSRRTEK